MNDWTPEWLRRVVTEHWYERDYEVICRLHNEAMKRANPISKEDFDNLVRDAMAWRSQR